MYYYNITLHEHRGITRNMWHTPLNSKKRTYSKSILFNNPYHVCFKDKIQFMTNSNVI